jgi:hypothetical protein
MNVWYSIAGIARRVWYSIAGIARRVWHWRGWRPIERVAHTLGIIFVLLVIAWIYVRPTEKSGGQQTFAGAEQQHKRLAIFLDGTWNSVDTNTSVWRMRALCAAKSEDGKPQLIYYEVGVHGFLGGTFGQGLDENIRLAYEWLIENYNDGDEIFIFGFSRGAFTARSLAGLVALEGVLKAGSPIALTQIFNRYKRGNEESIWTLKDVESSGNVSKLTDEERWLLRYSQPAKSAVLSSAISRPDCTYQSRTVTTRSPSTSIAATSRRRSGPFAIPKIRTRIWRRHARSPTSSNAGSWGHMLTWVAVTRPTFLPRLHCAG